MRIILGSSSPRRKELMSYLDYPFEIITKSIDETIDFNNDLRKEIEKLSYRKANAVFLDNQDAIVIGADTIVVIDNEVLGKPHTKEKAIEMLHKLENHTHQVITAVTIISKDKVDTFSTVSDVTFMPMSDEEIIEYVNTNEPLDKAGAYGIQGKAGKYVSHISGDYYSIMGFPMSEVNSRLKGFICEK